jgi:imidazoleglycerol phosphate synthase glutamine amidotransferase subunit HisH
MRNRPGRDLQNTVHCTYGILEKLRLAQHAFEEVHHIGWNKVKILKTDSSSRYMKYKEAAHMA